MKLGSFAAGVIVGAIVSGSTVAVGQIMRHGVLEVRPGGMVTAMCVDFSGNMIPNFQMVSNIIAIPNSVGQWAFGASLSCPR